MLIQMKKVVGKAELMVRPSGVPSYQHDGIGDASVPVGVKIMSFQIREETVSKTMIWEPL